VAVASAEFVRVALADSIEQQQRDIIDYLQEGNRGLREQPGARRMRPSASLRQRRRD